MKIINEKFDNERALYNLKDSTVENCEFKGPNDGESSLKESRNIEVINCSFSLRYPLWHTHKFKLVDSQLDENTRAPIWYSSKGEIINTKIDGVKAIRECNDIKINDSIINSKEFGWKSKLLYFENCEFTSEYFLFQAKRVHLNDCKLNGKNSFQYNDYGFIEDSYLDTKDAFWHSKNMVIINSVIKGEYLGWYSENLTFVNCKIIGSQPLCYCHNLRMIDCEMEDTDLSFEYSSVNCTINGDIKSIKNPRRGKIICDSVGEIINTDSIYKNKTKIITNNK